MSETTVATATKRKLDDVIGALDDAVRPPPEQRPSMPRPALSIYSTLAKYGIPTKTKPYRTPALAKYRRPKPANLTAASDLPLTAQYKPSSLEALLARLETFKIATYSSKPFQIDVVAAALSGWINDGKEQLTCGLCKASFVMGSTSSLPKGQVDAFVERTTKEFVSNHKDGCPWRTRQCEASLYSLPLTSPSQLVTELLRQASKLEPLIESVEIRHPLPEEKVAELRRALSSLLAKLERQQRNEVAEAGPSTSQAPPSKPPSPPPDSAILIALFGWEPCATISPPLLRRSSSVASLRSRTPSRAGTPAPSVSGMDVDEEAELTPQNTTLRCKMCNRRIGLWTFLPPKLSTSASSSGLTSRAATGTKPKVLDLVREHRSFCAYITKSTHVPSFAQGEEAAVREGYMSLLDTALRYGIGDEARIRALLGDRGPEGSSLLGNFDAALRDRGRELRHYVQRLLA